MLLLKDTLFIFNNDLCLALLSGFGNSCANENRVVEATRFDLCTACFWTLYMLQLDLYHKLGV